ncbi:hypothetical protein ACFQ6E_39020 [Streptomyces sp. NPDC056462]|uniref:hypothetical protein n=1 Tax=Streptomyces sp. NPDC056462 TaxID=3345826 RepID=UPI0036B5BC1C
MNPPLPGPRTPRHPNWPYAVTAILALALQTGWDPADVRSLGVVLLALIAVIASIDSRNP